MSGTSADGVDAALVDINSGNIEFRAAATQPYSESLQGRLLGLNATRALALDELLRLDLEIANAFADAANELVDTAGGAESVIAIGSHGQTIFHQPTGPFPGTLQLGNASVIAKKTGVNTIADFRSADMAHGGQGAPLTPAFNNAIFRAAQPRVILNLGGIANVTFLSDSTSGFDTGPANTLLDSWIKARQNEPFDRDGAWAKSGECIEPLLSTLLSDPFFTKEPPKSTGPDYFNLQWLQSHMTSIGKSYRPQDVQATLAELTAASVASSITLNFPNGVEILLCGGGSHNSFLVERLKERCPNCTITTTEETCGLSVDHCESVAFAWLAYRYIARLPGNLPDVTGAAKPVVLGALHQATCQANYHAPCMDD